MQERATLTARLALPRGIKVPAGGIVRFGKCESAPAAVDIPFAVIQSRVQTGVPARCSEASLRVDGFAPAMLPLRLNGDIGTVELKPGAAAALRVRARRDARPLAGIRVEAVRADELRSMRDELRTEHVALASGITDSAGWARLGGLPEDEIVFLFVSPARTYPQMSEAYVLRAGEEAVIEDTLLDDPANGKYVVFDDPEKEVAIELSSGRIQGRVVDGTGAAVAGALVSATQQFSQPRATSFARNRSDGTFVLESISPGSWEIVAETSGGRSDTATVSFDESDPEGLTLLLEPIRKVIIRVVDVTGAPVRDAFVTVEFPRAGSPASRTYIQTTGPEGGAEFRLSRAEQATLTNVVVATTDLRLSCNLRRLDKDQTVTVAPVGGEVRLIGLEISRGAQGWLVSSSGCAVPFIGTRVETERSGERTIVFPSLAAGTWSYVETRSGEELARLLTGQAASLSPLKTFTVESGKNTRVNLGRGAR